MNLGRMLYEGCTIDALMLALSEVLDGVTMLDVRVLLSRGVLVKERRKNDWIYFHPRGLTYAMLVEEARAVIAERLLNPPPKGYDPFTGVQYDRLVVAK